MIPLAQCYTPALHCNHSRPLARLMTPKKTSTLNLRIDPLLKEAARVAAQREHRSIGNLIEVLIRKHCEEVGIPVPEQQSLFKEGNIDE